MPDLTPKQILDEMQQLMTGREWECTDLCEELASMMRRAGYIIGDPEYDENGYYHDPLTMEIEQ